MKGIVDIVFDAVESVTGVHRDRIVSDSRDNSVNLARNLVVLLLRGNSMMSLQEIADSMGKRDHTTPRNSLKRATRDINANLYYMKQYERADDLVQEAVEAL